MNSSQVNFPFGGAVFELCVAEQEHHTHFA